MLFSHPWWTLAGLTFLTALGAAVFAGVRNRLMDEEFQLLHSSHPLYDLINTIRMTANVAGIVGGIVGTLTGLYMLCMATNGIEPAALLGILGVVVMFPAFALTTMVPGMWWIPEAGHRSGAQPTHRPRAST